MHLSSSLESGSNTPNPHMLAQRNEFEAALYQRRLLRFERDTDTSLHCLYRLDESIVLDSNVGMRNEIEYLFRRHT